mgnify:FL=1
MSDVIDAVVVGREDNKWGEVPVAVIIVENHISLEKNIFLNRFQNNLARFKHPKDVIFLKELPRNAMGKVLKYEVRKLVNEQ